MALSGLPRHRENREFGGPFFQTGKTQGICQKTLKIHFYTGNLTPTQGKFGGEKKIASLQFKWVESLSGCVVPF